MTDISLRCRELITRIKKLEDKLKEKIDLKGRWKRHNIRKRNYVSYNLEVSSYGNLFVIYWKLFKGISIIHHKQFLSFIDVVVSFLHKIYFETEKERTFRRAMHYRRMRYERSCLKNHWNSFFDIGLGKIVDNPKMISDYEKKGNIYATDREIKQEASKYKRMHKEESRQKLRKEVRESLVKIKQGYSYRNSINEQARKAQQQNPQGAAPQAFNK